MAERCERCGGRTVAIWRKPGTHDALPLCVKHNNLHGPALAAQGWSQHRLAKA